MFNAQAARAMARQQSAVTPEALLSLKKAIVGAAEQGKSSVDVAFPFLLQASAGETISSWRLVDLLRTEQHLGWAEAVSQAGAAGYTVAPTRGQGSSGRLNGLRLTWLQPRDATADCLLLTARMAERLTESANARIAWAQPLLAEVQRVAGLRRSMVVWRDKTRWGDGAWVDRLAYLKSLGFDVQGEGTTSTTLTVLW